MGDDGMKETKTQPSKDRAIKWLKGQARGQPKLMTHWAAGMGWLGKT
jgi:hypothetical protein